MDVNESWQTRAGELLRTFPSAGREMVEAMLEEHGTEPLAMSLAAWLIACHAPEEMLEWGCDLAEKACTLDPENLEFHHTAAWCWASREVWEPVMVHLGVVLASPFWVEPWVEDLAHLCLKSLPSGNGKAMLNLLESSRSNRVLAGVSVALRIRMELPLEAGEGLKREARQHLDAYDLLYAPIGTVIPTTDGSP